jgi:hypothetical protein
MVYDPRNLNTDSKDIFAACEKMAVFKHVIESPINIGSNKCEEYNFIF